MDTEANSTKHDNLVEAIWAEGEWRVAIRDPNVLHKKADATFMNNVIPRGVEHPQTNDMTGTQLQGHAGLPGMADSIRTLNPYALVVDADADDNYEWKPAIWVKNAIGNEGFFGEGAVGTNKTQHTNVADQAVVKGLDLGTWQKAWAEVQVGNAAGHAPIVTDLPSSHAAQNQQLGAYFRAIPDMRTNEDGNRVDKAMVPAKFLAPGAGEVGDDGYVPAIVLDNEGPDNRLELIYAVEDINSRDRDENGFRRLMPAIQDPGDPQKLVPAKHDLNSWQPAIWSSVENKYIFAIIDATGRISPAIHSRVNQAQLQAANYQGGVLEETMQLPADPNFAVLDPNQLGANTAAMPVRIGSLERGNANVPFVAADFNSDNLPYVFIPEIPLGDYGSMRQPAQRNILIQPPLPDNSYGGGDPRRRPDYVLGLYPQMPGRQRWAVISDNNELVPAIPNINAHDGSIDPDFPLVPIDVPPARVERSRLARLFAPDDPGGIEETRMRSYANQQSNRALTDGGAYSEALLKKPYIVKLKAVTGKWNKTEAEFMRHDPRFVHLDLISRKILCTDLENNVISENTLKKMTLNFVDGEAVPADIPDAPPPNAGAVVRANDLVERPNLPYGGDIHRAAQQHDEVSIMDIMGRSCAFEIKFGRRSEDGRDKGWLRKKFTNVKNASVFGAAAAAAGGDAGYVCGTFDPVDIVRIRNLFQADGDDDIRLQGILANPAAAPGWTQSGHKIMGDLNAKGLYSIIASLLREADPDKTFAAAPPDVPGQLLDANGDRTQGHGFRAPELGLDGSAYLSVQGVNDPYGLFTGLSKGKLISETDGAMFIPEGGGAAAPIADIDFLKLLKIESLACHGHGDNSALLHADLRQLIAMNMSGVGGLFDVNPDIHGQTPYIMLSNLLSKTDHEINLYIQDMLEYFTSGFLDPNPRGDFSRAAKEHRYPLGLVAGGPVGLAPATRPLELPELPRPSPEFGAAGADLNTHEAVNAEINGRWQALCQSIQGDNRFAIGNERLKRAFKIHMIIHLYGERTEDDGTGAVRVRAALSNADILAHFVGAPPNAQADFTARENWSFPAPMTEIGTAAPLNVPFMPVVGGGRKKRKSHRRKSYRRKSYRRKSTRRRSYRRKHTRRKSTRRKSKRSRR